jgi:hypothetical protein
VVAVAAALLLTPRATSAQEAQRRQYESMPTAPTPTPLTPAIKFPDAEDDEIGRQFLLKRRVAVPQFSLSGDAQYFYNSNPRLLEDNANDDFLFVGTTTLAWNPTWIKGANVSVFGRQQFFRYNNSSDMDFNSTAFGLSVGTPVRDWFTVSYGYTMDYFHTSPGSFNRITHGIFAGLNYAITPKLLGQFFYRFQYEDYNDIAREDRSHVLSITLSYFITDWASVRAFASWTTNKSTIDRNYDALSSGVGASVVWRF